MCALVTGVQTCALPIWGKPTASGDALGAGFGQLRLGQLGAILGGGGAASLGQGCQHRLLGDGPEKFDTAFPMVAHIEIGGAGNPVHRQRSEEHTSELQSLMRISYAVFCLKKKKKTIHNEQN